MSKPQTLTIIARYEPDEERQAAAVLLLLGRGLRRGAPEALGSITESHRPRLAPRTADQTDAVTTTTS
jgi:hypothetical protein